jgi:iron complex outermembrane receptor protein
LGGLINIESERPADTFGGFVAMRAGSFSTWNPYGDLNVPLGSGVAARIATEYQSNGSWIDQVKGDRWSVQPSISFQIDPNTDLLLQGQFNHTDRLEYSGLPASQALAGQIDRYAFPGAPIGQPHTMVDSKMATATLVHAFTDDLKLTVSGRYYDSQIPEYGSFVADQPDPSTPTTYDIVPLYLNTRTKEGTFDTNLSEKADLLGGRHEFLAGIDYDQTHYDAVSGYNGVSDGVLDLAQPVYNLPFGGALPIIASQTDSYQTIAVYVQDQATYGRLHLTGSLRYTNISFHEVEQGTDQTYNH